jgi:hypothetical protein
MGKAHPLYSSGREGEEAMKKSVWCWDSVGVFYS